LDILKKKLNSIENQFKEGNEYTFDSEMCDKVGFYEMLVQTYHLWIDNVKCAMDNKIPVIHISFIMYMDGINRSKGSKIDQEVMFVTCSQFPYSYRSSSNLMSVLDLLFCSKGLTKEHSCDALTSLYIDEFKELSKGMY
jgi:hypothetical protein